MAALTSDGNTTLPEAPPPTTTDGHRRGGWITTPFIIASMFGLTLASTGWLNNLIVFLIKNFNIKSIDAAQINNVVNGCVSFFPLIGAVIADSLLGCFSVIWISSLISLLGLILLVLTVTLDSLRPPFCDATTLNSCSSPSRTQYAVLYSALALASIGVGGTRFTLATLGANQFNKLHQQSSYFDWYFFSLYSAYFIGTTGIVYMEDNLSWGWGFGICIAANVLALALFLLGGRHYLCDKPRASPFVAMFRVVVASVRKRKAVVSSDTKDYYYGDHQVKGVNLPTKRFRLLNRAALKTDDSSILANGSVATPWKLCSVEQVEDLKSVIRILPLWSSSIFLGTPIGVQISLTVLQALAADRRLGRSFQFPAGSIIVFSFIATAIGVALINHWLRPMWKRMAGKNPTPLQQLGIGHVFNIASMAVSAIVESRRRSGDHLMPVMWLVPQMVIVGMGEAFLLPAQVGLYYQEFPTCLKSLATAMVSMLIGVAFYLSTAVVDLLRRITNWLPDDINHGRLDYVYWVMGVIGLLNFGYFLVISCLYDYKNVQVEDVNKADTDEA